MDKVLHFFGGFIIGLIFAFATRFTPVLLNIDYKWNTLVVYMGVSGLIGATIAGLIKEYKDHKEEGDFSVLDMLFTILGGVTVLLICVFSLRY